MTKREMIKPFAWGLVGGATALTIGAFSAGWVVTGSSNHRQVQAAWVDSQATVCSSLAQAHRKASGDVADLSDYKARDTRDTLAKTFAVVLPGQETAVSGVISACSDLLRSNSVVAAKQ
jgi:hypothetical protein